MAYRAFRFQAARIGSVMTTFDILAKAPAGTPDDPPEMTSAAAVRWPKVRQMLQTLLAERFRLAVHREAKDMPVYALVVAKNGPKLKEATEQQNEGFFRSGRGRIQSEHATLSEFAF